MKEAVDYAIKISLMEIEKHEAIIRVFKQVPWPTSLAGAYSIEMIHNEKIEELKKELSEKLRTPPV